jgi:hypothetical protein
MRFVKRDFLKLCLRIFSVLVIATVVCGASIPVKAEEGDSTAIAAKSYVDNFAIPKVNIDTEVEEKPDNTTVPSTLAVWNALEGIELTPGPQGPAGENGAPGADGKSAYEVYVETTSDDPVKTEAEWLAGLKGADGEKGETGDKGEDGGSISKIATSQGGEPEIFIWIQ